MSENIAFYIVEEMPEYRPERAGGGKSLLERKKDKVWQVVEKQMDATKKVVATHLTGEQAQNQVDERNRLLGHS